MHINIYVCSFIHTCVRMYTYVYEHIAHIMQKYVVYVDIHTHTQTHTHTHTRIAQYTEHIRAMLHTFVFHTGACACVFVFVCVFVCMSVYVCIYVSMHACM